jgi:rhodanese-related sulfurtransferase
VPGARNIGLNGQFASWAGALLPVRAKLVLVAEDLEGVRQARLRLARVGIENVVGYLDGGLAEWARGGRPVEAFENITPRELAARIEKGAAPVVFDVRRPGEFAGGHVPGAQSRPLGPGLMVNGSEARAPLAIICQSGYRSVVAASLLAATHPGPIWNIAGGTLAWADAGLPFDTPLTTA